MEHGQPRTLNPPSGVVGLESSGAGSCNLPTDSCKRPTEEIGLWVLKISISTHSPKWGIFSPKLCIFKENFRKEERYLTLEFRGPYNCWCWPATTPLNPLLGRQTEPHGGGHSSLSQSVSSSSRSSGYCECAGGRMFGRLLAT